MSKMIKLIGLLLLLPTISFAGPYYGTEIDVDAGTTTHHISGLVGIAASSTTFSTYTITLNGIEGAGTFTSSVTGSAFFGNGSNLTGIEAGIGVEDDVAWTGVHSWTSSVTVSNIVSASRYDIDRNTFLASLAGTGSMGIGIGAGKINTGSYNTFAGYGAGEANVEGDFNSFFGYHAGHYMASRTKCTLIGCNAGIVGAGDNNTFIGYGAGAGKGEPPGDASNSTFIGVESGHNINCGVNNLFLGYKTGYNVETGSNNIIIGYNLTAPTVSTNSYLSIGDLIYGDIDDGWVGINVADPKYSLDVENAIHTSSDVIANTYWGDGSNLTGIAGGNGAKHAASWIVTGHPFTSSTTAYGLWPKIMEAGTIKEIRGHLSEGTTEEFKVHFKDTTWGSNSWNAIVTTMTFVATNSSSTVTGLDYSLTKGDIIGIGMFDITASTDSGRDLSITIYWE